MLKLNLQYFGHLMRRTDSLEKTLMLRKIEGRWGSHIQLNKWLVTPEELERQVGFHSSTQDDA